MPALGLTIKDIAAALGVSRQTLHGILAERHAVTPEMALRLGKLCGNGRRRTIKEADHLVRPAQERISDAQEQMTDLRFRLRKPDEERRQAQERPVSLLADHRETPAP